VDSKAEFSGGRRIRVIHKFMTAVPLVSLSHFKELAQKCTAVRVKELKFGG
jgi:hypothetical protein